MEHDGYVGHANIRYPPIMASPGDMAPARTQEPTERLLTTVLVVAWLGIAAWSLGSGLPYYRLALEDRPYSELHDLYDSAGRWGHLYGSLGSLCMLIGVAGYSLRKRWHRLERAGRLATWLRIHIFLCTIGPFLVVVHTAFRVGGLIAISFWSMVAVVASGVFGRYVYARLPKGGNGLVDSPVSLRRRSMELLSRLRAHAVLDEDSLLALTGGADPAVDPGLGQAFMAAIRFDLDRRRLPNRIAAQCTAMGVSAGDRDRLLPDLVEYREIRQQLDAFRPFQRLFGYWHVFHLPFALVMLLIALLHVGVAVAFGYGWGF